MNKATFYALVGAALGWYRSRTKKGRVMNAAKYAVGGYLLVNQVAPRVGITLPAPSNIRA